MSNTPPISPRTPLPTTTDASPIASTGTATPQYFTPISPMSFSATSASTPLAPRISSSSEDHSPIAQRVLFGENSATTQPGIISPQEAMDIAWGLICKAQGSALPNHSTYQRALAIATEGLLADPSHIGLLTIKAKCLFARANYTLASETAMHILQLDPENAEATVLLYDCDDLQSSAQMLQFDQLSISSSPDPKFGKAVELILSCENLADAKGLSEKLFTEAEWALEREPGSTTHLAIQILCLTFQGNLGRLTEFLEQTARFEPLFGLMMQALESSEQVLGKEPHHGTALQIKTSCLFFKTQRDQLLTSLQEMVSADHDPRTAKLEDCLALLTGTQHPSLREVHEKTLTSAEQLLKRDPHNLMGFMVRAESLRLLGRADEALEMVNYALSRYPDDDVLLTQLAACLLPFHAGKAHHIAEQVVSKDPQKNLFTWMIKLQCLCKMDDREEIVRALKQAKECFPTNMLLQELYKHYVSERS